MKIAINIQPLDTGHAFRGIGSYIRNLIKSLQEYSPQNDYIFFKKMQEIPNDIDIVHYPYFDPFFITLPFAKKGKLVVTIHDLTPLIFKKYFPPGFKGKV